jgi:hypothetical protein
MKTKKNLTLHGLLLAFVFVVTSCNINSEFDEVKPVPADKKAGVSGVIGPILSFPVSVGRIDLFTVTGDYVSGTVTVQIRNADGTVVLGTSVVSGANLLKGNSIRNTFTFAPAVTLNSRQKYRIYVTRSNPHNFMTDHVSWRTCSSGVNAYTPGVPDVFVNSGWVLDYSFVTFSDGYVDQQQTSTNYGFAISNTSYRWQEFVPQKIWVVQP